MSSLFVRTNLASLEGQMNLGTSPKALAVSFDRLSSGQRVTPAAQDSTGVASGGGIKSQVRSLVAAERSAGHALSLVQTAEGALGELHSIVSRIRELAARDASGSSTATDPDSLELEVQALEADARRVQQAAVFDGQALLARDGFQHQVALNDVGIEPLTVSFSGFDLSALTASRQQLHGPDPNSALEALEILDASLASIADARTHFGAEMTRLDTALSSIQTMRLNLAATRSGLEDVESALGTSTETRGQIAAQPAASVAAQATQLSPLVLNLIE